MYLAPTLKDREHYLGELEAACKVTGKTLITEENIPSVDEVQAFVGAERVLIIVDDLLSFKKDLERLTDLMVMHSHHLGWSVLFCVQNPFFKSSKLDLTTLSRNLTGRFILYQTNDWLQYQLLSSRLFPEKKSFLLHCLTDAKKKFGFNYVYCNVHCFSKVERRYLCYTGIFKDERVKYALAAGSSGSPIFFDLEG